MPENHAVRRDRLRALVASLPAGTPFDSVVPELSLLVTQLVNVRYLTGFTGSNAALLVTADDAVLATDGRYITQAEQQVPDLERLIDRQCAAALVDRARKNGVGMLGFEAHDVTVELYETLRSTGEGVELVASGLLVEQLRAVKDEDEIALIRQACAIGDQALTELFPTIVPGRTEREIGRDLENRMRDHGATGIAFETIVATGPNSAVPHHRPTDRAVATGDLLKIDFGALYDGYHADCTRTAVVAEPADWQREIHGLVREAQRAGRHALAPGVDVRRVDAAARDVIAAAGFGEQFSHGLGHGVGLEIHEAPRVSYDADGRLADRTPVTVEPGVYLPGRGGVRIEDTLVVRTGGPELLTRTPKDLLVL